MTPTNLHLAQRVTEVTPFLAMEIMERAKELEAESKGKKRWSVLAKSLDALKAMGKAVYERVAIPLLLDMLKKEVGL